MSNEKGEISFVGPGAGLGLAKAKARSEGEQRTRCESQSRTVQHECHRTAATIPPATVLPPSPAAGKENGSAGRFPLIPHPCFSGGRDGREGK